jgi:hypothetical protein
VPLFRLIELILTNVATDKLQAETANLAASRRLGTVPQYRSQQPQTYNAQGSTSSQRVMRASFDAQAREKASSDDEGTPTDEGASSEEKGEHTYPPKPSLGPPPRGLVTVEQNNKVQKQAQKVLAFAREEPTEAVKSTLGVVAVAGNAATIAGLLLPNPALVVAGAVISAGVNSGTTGLNTTKAWRDHQGKQLEKTKKAKRR